LAAALMVAQPAAALEVPALQRRVNDRAGLLSEAARRQLETALEAFETRESTQIAVLTVPTLGGETIEEFSIRVAQGWQLGQRGRDNGALLVVAKGERKIRIEVGYGLEGRLTDLLAGRIIREVITPEFKAGRFDAGIIAGVEAMMSAVRGEFQGGAESGDSPRFEGKTLETFLFFMVILIGLIAAGRPVVGAALGGFFAPLVGVFLKLGLTLVLLLIPAGALAGLLLSRFSHPGRHGGRRGGNGGIGGGIGFGTGGGGFSSGGFSGGGFSGGGGGFGGGGASGSW